jgi:chemosensory pili system protein ChpA (sensor histidine kinase/response regulator)
LPVLLIRGGDQRIAIQVDQLIGSREIVVKSVGSQLASVAGISGATILGDGSVVIILDAVAMLRAASRTQPRLATVDGEVGALPAAAEAKSYPYGHGGRRLRDGAQGDLAPARTSWL